MKMEIYSEEDIVHIDLEKGKFAHVKSLDDSRHLAYSDTGEVMRVALLKATDGVDPGMLQPVQREEAARELEKHGIRATA